MNIYALLAAVILLFSFNTQGNDSVDKALLQQLKTALNANDYTLVLELSEQYGDQYFGEPEFDFMFGVAALKTNRSELSVFAFERVIANRPSWLDARLYLAQAYYHTTNYQSAIEQCEQVLANTNNVDKLNQLASSICLSANKKLNQQSTTIKNSFNALLGNDSNINAGTREEKIFLPFLDDFINLDEASKEQSDQFVQLGYQFNMSTALTQTSKLNVYSQINAHNFIHETDYNRIVAQVGIDYLTELSMFDINIGGRLTPLWFDGDYYRMQSAFITGIKTQLSDVWAISGSLMLGKTNNNQNQLLDTDDYSIGLGSSYIQGNWRHSINIGRLEEEGALESNSRIIDSVTLNNLWLINHDWLASVDLSFQDHEYKGTHPFYLKKRTDDVWQLSSFIQYSFSQSLIYRFNINIQDKSSNLDLFSYDRVEISLSARMNF